MTPSHFSPSPHSCFLESAQPTQIINHPFSKKISKLAKRMSKISQSNANTQIKNLRIDILNKLEMMIETLRDAIIQYPLIPSSKLNYRDYHEPILKLGKRYQLYFKKIMKTFDCEETRMMYHSMKKKWMVREASFSLLEALLKWGSHSSFERPLI